MPEPFGAAVWRNVRRLREGRAQSGAALARVAAVAQSHLWALEAGKIRNPGASVLRPLARTLGVTVDELLQDEQRNRDEHRLQYGAS